jgi:acyl carrier protein
MTLRGLESRMERLWARVLEVDTVPPDADFFELGGNSLLVAELVLMLEDEAGIAVASEDVFAAPSIAALARRLDAGSGATTPAVPRLPRRTEC